MCTNIVNYETRFGRNILIRQFFCFRWTKLRQAMVPLTVIFEPIAECMMLGVMAAWSTSFLFRWEPIAVFLVHLLAWFISDWLMIHIVQV